MHIYFLVLCNPAKNFQIFKVCHHCYLLFVFISLNSNVVLVQYVHWASLRNVQSCYKKNQIILCKIFDVHHHLNDSSSYKTKIFVRLCNEELFFFVSFCAPSTMYAYKIWACFNSVFVHRGFKIQIFHSRNSICLFSNPQYAIIQIVIPYIKPDIAEWRIMWQINSNNGIKYTLLSRICSFSLSLDASVQYNSNNWSIC